MATTLHLNKYRRCLDSTCTIQASGQVTNIVGLVIEAQGPLSAAQDNGRGFGIPGQ